MCPFTGRAKEKVNIPTKPTPEGFKRWTIADSGYFINWVWHIKGTGPVCPRVQGLNPTQGVVACLIDRLPNKATPGRYHVWLDNLFTSVTLCTYFYDRGIGCSGTARTNSGVHQRLVDKKKNATLSNSIWGEIFTEVLSSGHICSVGWIDHGMVLFLINAMDPYLQVERLRKRPAKTSKFAAITRKPFAGATKKVLSIPQLVDSYNLYMGGVDRGDQIRAQGSTPPAIKGWKALFYDSIQLALCNAYLLSIHARVGSQQRYDHYELFRRDAAAAFIRSGGDFGEGLQHPRLDFMSKTNIALPKQITRRNEGHERIAMPQRVCKVCRRNARCITRGLKSGRVPLGNLDQNTLPQVSRPLSGCKTCGVNLCKRGRCWDIYHLDLDLRGGVGG